MTALTINEPSTSVGTSLATPRRKSLHSFRLWLVWLVTAMSIGGLATSGLSTPARETLTSPPAHGGVLPVNHAGIPLQRDLLADAGIITDDYDPPAQNWLAGHRGIDLHAPQETDIRTPQSGTLTFAGVVGGKDVVVVTHPSGLRSTFEPAQTTMPVGTSLGTGQVFATVSRDHRSHCAQAQCVHWGVKDGRNYIDPWLVLAPWKNVRLVD